MIRRVLCPFCDWYLDDPGATLPPSPDPPTPAVILHVLRQHDGDIMRQWDAHLDTHVIDMIDAAGGGTAS